MGLSTADLTERYEANHAAGVKTLLQGELVPFPGLKRDLQNNLIMAARFGRSEQLGSLLGELAKLEEGEDGFSFALANRDFPLHCTLGQARPASGDAWFVQNRLRDIFDVAPRRITSLRFNRVRFSGAAAEVLLLGDELDPQMDITRSVFAALTELYGREQLMSPPIQHCTLTRNLTGKVSHEERQVLVRLVEKWDERLRAEPLILNVSYHFVDSVYELLSSHGMEAVD